ncbi:MAG: Phosphatidate cytidylyltransferase [Clostridia bacterium]|nr:Phosphatidate cytidylyltransferase [Clostridia bacterium]
MRERIISASVIVVIILVFIFLSGAPFVLNIAVALLGAGALCEVLIVTKYVESKSLMFISLIFAFLIPFIPDFSRLTFTLGIFAFTMILFITLLSAYEIFNIEHLSVVFLMSIIIPYFYATLIYARRMDAGFYNLLYIFLCAWSTDTGGYIFGKMFGRHKLTPTISPKKTVEGAIGGVAASVISTLCLSYIIDVFDNNIIVNYSVIILYSLTGGIIAILGDLTASVIKRNFGVKDFGRLIPGHGGIMDRFDSVLFVAPMIYLSLNLYPAFMLIN